VAFSVFKKYQIDLFQTIVFNYWVCAITGTLVLGEVPLHISDLQQDWFKMAILMGILFISVFNLIAICSIRVGVTATQTANKLSFIIPVLVSVWLYNEGVSMVKALGIGLALLAVVFTSYQSESIAKQKIQPMDYALPIILFFGSGIIDTLTKYVQQRFLHTEAMSNTYLISGFMIAAIFGSIVLGYLYFSGRKKFSYRNVVAGIILGVPNYFSIYFLVKALQDKSISSTATIPINNIGVLILVSLFGIFILKEKLHKVNYAGLFLALVAIVLIFLGD
jgi:drug/metabolite transporter (DMT)-like permease